MNNSKQIENNKIAADSDCLECRLVGAFSFTLIGLYLWSQAKRRSKIEKFTIQLISLSSIGIGASRLLNPAALFMRKEK